MWNKSRMRGVAGHALKLLPLSHITRNSNAVLLYHATFSEPPAELREGLHNITPETLFRQLEELKKIFTIVSIDELFEAGSRSGLAAITFDDGYQSVLEEGLPVLQSLELPFTIFINSQTLSGQIFWRDKVRYLINNRLVEKFESANSYSRPVEQSFYKFTKQNHLNSKDIDTCLDHFLKREGVLIQQKNYCFDDNRFFINHPLVSYGNHTHSHYVLSSLSGEQQYSEISTTHEVLQRMTNINRSRIFSIPFGGIKDFDGNVVKIVSELGYEGFLLSRNHLDLGKKRGFDLPLRERFMPVSGDIRQQLRHTYLRSLRFSSGRN